MAVLMHCSVISYINFVISFFKKAFQLSSYSQNVMSFVIQLIKIHYVCFRIRNKTFRLLSYIHGIPFSIIFITQHAVCDLIHKAAFGLLFD